MAKNSKRNRAAEEAAKAKKLAAEDAAAEAAEEAAKAKKLAAVDDKEEKKEGFIKRAGRWVKTQYEKEHKLPSWSVKKIVTTLVGAATGAAVVVTAYKLGEAVGSGAINDQLELEDNDTGDTGESEVIDGDYEE